jgi:hypothetical protein
MRRCYCCLVSSGFKHPSLSDKIRTIVAYLIVGLITLPASAYLLINWPPSAVSWLGAILGVSTFVAFIYLASWTPGPSRLGDGEGNANPHQRHGENR